MAQSHIKAVDQFIESEVFILGVLSYEFTEIREQLIKMLEAYHHALAIQSVRTYAQNRYSTDQVVKPALREQPMARIEFYPRKYYRRVDK